MRIKNVENLIKVREKEYESNYDLINNDILRIINYKCITENDNKNLIDLIQLLYTENDSIKTVYYLKGIRFRELFIQFLNKGLFVYTDLLIKEYGVDVNNFGIQVYFDRYYSENKFDYRVSYLVGCGFIYENIYYNKFMDDEYNEKNIELFEEKNLRLKMFLREMKIKTLKTSRLYTPIIL